MIAYERFCKKSAMSIGCSADVLHSWPSLPLGIRISLSDGDGRRLAIDMTTNDAAMLVEKLALAVNARKK